MNIFFLDLDPETCAKMHVNTHVIKILNFIKFKIVSKLKTINI